MATLYEAVFRKLSPGILGVQIVQSYVSPGEVEIDDVEYSRFGEIVVRFYPIKQNRFLKWINPEEPVTSLDELKDHLFPDVIPFVDTENALGYRVPGHTNFDKRMDGFVITTEPQYIEQLRLLSQNPKT